jgi:hypothetical protein
VAEPIDRAPARVRAAAARHAADPDRERQHAEAQAAIARVRAERLERERRRRRPPIDPAVRAWRRKHGLEGDGLVCDEDLDAAE